MTERKSLSKRTRFEIFKRDGFKCLYCGATPVQKVLRVDHVVPAAEGGTDDPANLVTSCFDCNAGKAAVPLDQQKFKTEIATEAHKEHAEQIREWLAVQRDVHAAKEEAIDQVLDEWERRVGPATRSLRPRLWKMLEEFGLARLVEAFDIVAASGPSSGERQIKYLHGILRRWREESPPSKDPKPAVVSGQSRHAQRALAAVTVAVGEINEAPEQFPTEESRQKYIFIAFARAAWGSRRNLKEAKWAAGRDFADFDVRGLRIHVLREPERVAYRVTDIPDFNPWEHATNELQSIIQGTHKCNWRHEGHTSFEDAAVRIRALAFEVLFWVDCFVGRVAEAERDHLHPGEVD